MNEARDIIIRGAAFLDEKHPTWWREIELPRFDIREPCLCVLGQVGAAMIGCSNDPMEFGDVSSEEGRHFRSGFDMLVADWLGNNYHLTETYGFESGEVPYDDLQREWVIAIKERQQEAGLLVDNTGSASDSVS